MNIFLLCSEIKKKIQLLDEFS